MKTMTTIPVTKEIGRTKVDRIQILRARGRTSAQIANDLELDVYVVDEVFAWHDLLCGIRAQPQAPAAQRLRPHTAARTISRRDRVSA